jgi:hypothetical protein
MNLPCIIPGCKASVPEELASAGQCVSHYTLEVERQCTDMRLETVRGTTTPERRAEIFAFIGQQGGLLARVATGTARLPDEIKARILSTFLTLMNLRENVERAAARGVPSTHTTATPAKR